MNCMALHLWFILINVLEVVIWIIDLLSDRVSVSTKTEDVNVNIFNDNMNQNHWWNIFNVNIVLYKNDKKCTSKRKWKKR